MLSLEGWRQSCQISYTGRLCPDFAYGWHIVPKRGVGMGKVKQPIYIRAMLASVGISRRVSVALTCQYCVKTAKHRITQTTPRSSSGTLVFWRQQLLVGDTPFPLKFALKVTHPPFQTQQFPPISTQRWELANKVRLALIRSPTRAFQRAIDEPCMLPLSP